MTATRATPVLREEIFCPPQQHRKISCRNGPFAVHPKVRGGSTDRCEGGLSLGELLEGVGVVMEIRTALRNHSALAFLTDEARDALAAVSTMQRLRRGATVWHPGEPATHFVVIAQGLVKVQMQSGARRAIVLSLRGPGESAGDAAAFMGTSYEDEARALTEGVVVVRSPRWAVLKALGENGSAACELAGLISRGALVAKLRLAVFTCSAEERLATMLIELGERFGDDLEDGATLIPLRLTRTELASLVGTTVETTIRTLSRWAREGLVTTGQGGMTLHDADALARRSAQAVAQSV